MVGEGRQGMDGFDNDDMEGPRCQCPWEWVLYREICLSPTHDHQYICRKQHFHCQIFCRLYEWISTYCQLVSVDMIKLAHFLCNQFRSDIQKTRLQDVDDYKQRQVCIQAAEEKYPRKKGDTMTAELILGRFFPTFIYEKASPVHLNLHTSLKYWWWLFKILEQYYPCFSLELKCLLGWRHSRLCVLIPSWISLHLHSKVLLQQDFLISVWYVWSQRWPNIDPFPHGVDWFASRKRADENADKMMMIIRIIWHWWWPSDDH